MWALGQWGEEKRAEEREGGVRSTADKEEGGTSLVVQWLRPRASTAGGAGSIPGRGTKIPHASRHGQKRKVQKKKRK